MSKVKLLTLLTVLLICLYSRGQIINTIAGNGTSVSSGNNGPATSAGIVAPSATVMDKWGNLYIAEEGSNIIRKVDGTGIISTFAGNGTAGYSGDSGQAKLASFNNITAIAIDTQGNIFLIDAANYRVRKIDLAGIVTTIAGIGAAGYSGDGGSATAAWINWCSGLAVDRSNNIYIADEVSSVVRKVDGNGIISTLAGTGTAGYTGDGGQASQAQLFSPTGLAVDANLNVFIADENANVVRKVNQNGIISTYAGNGTPGFSGDGSLAINAELNTPAKVATDKKGNLYIADLFNKRIRSVDTNGVIQTVAGNGTTGFAGDGGSPLLAEFNNVQGLFCDQNNDVYISDFANDRVRKISFVNSIGSNEVLEELRIYPNPATSCIKIPSRIVTNKISIYNMKGVRLEYILQQNKIDISSFENGMYCLAIEDQGRIFKQIFIVCH